MAGVLAPVLNENKAAHIESIHNAWPLFKEQEALQIVGTGPMLRRLG